jgi:hypothetical protein
MVTGANNKPRDEVVTETPPSVNSQRNFGPFLSFRRTHSYLHQGSEKQIRAPVQLMSFFNFNTIGYVNSNHIDQ